MPQLRERLKIAGDASNQRYDAAVALAVKHYQEANHVRATGSPDARTVKELNASTHDNQIGTMIANMERWRWYPRDLGSAHVVKSGIRRISRPAFEELKGGSQALYVCTDALASSNYWNQHTGGRRATADDARVSGLR